MPRQHMRVLVLVFALLVAVLGPPVALGASSASAAPSAPSALQTHGLKGEYFTMSAPGARDFAQLGGTSLDPNIDFPDLVPTFQQVTGQGEHTTARWTGQIQAPTTGAYTFSAIGDNGFRLWINDQPVIDHWVGDWDREQTSQPVTLTAGVQYTFKMELFQDTGGANLFLRWSGPGIAKSIVPESAFTPPAGFETYPVELTLGADGLHLEAKFSDAVTSLGKLPQHLQVQADTTPMPITSVSLKPGDPSTVVVTLGEAVFKDQKVKFLYDGQGGLTVGGAAVPAINRTVVNSSTQRMKTTWADQVDKNNPLPKYPRPQMVRERWLNLNGQWEFAAAKEGQQPAFGTTLGERITVPYPVESQLSGFERHEDYMFYRKLVSVPANWKVGNGQRLKLNFGAVDYLATVYVNGTKVTEHKGGYTAFSADITDALKGTGQQEIIVAVMDKTDVQHQSIGKQSQNPGGIVYTASSGIWQTVWMEPVPDKGINNLVLTPNIANSTLGVTVKASNATPGTKVKLRAYDAEGKNAGVLEGAVNTNLVMPVKKQHLWTPNDPYLYNLTVELKDGPERDTVTSYFGMRSVAIQQVGGYQKIVINGAPIFSLAMLDQGFWPDGLYTAPTDEALRWDLQAQKDLGFNAVRKHIKVEPARWYAHADKIGLLVWQDFVSGDHVTAEDKRQWFAEGREMMDELHNSPSIIGWIPFNEGWGEWDRTATGQIAEQVKAADPSRLVDAHSGVNCCNSKGDSGKGDIIDHHDYNNVDPPFPDATRAAMDGEHGGFTLRTPGHMWPGPPLAIYSGVETKAALTKRYVDNTRSFYLAQAAAELSGSVYTQVTDLEHEINGMWTYDRKVLKVDAAAVRDINLKVVAAGANAGKPISYPGQGCWGLNEGAGTTSADGCGTSPMTTTGNPSWTAGVTGSALHFNGTDQYAETAGPVVDTTKDYSVSAWAKLDAVPGDWRTVVSQDGRATANPFYLQYGQGGFAFSMPGDVRARWTVTPEPGRWYHLVGVRDHATNELRLYVDGQRVATSPAGVDGVSTGPLSIGRAEYAGQNGDYWPGSVDQVQVVGRALSDQEVTALFTKR